MTTLDNGSSIDSWDDLVACINELNKSSTMESLTVNVDSDINGSGATADNALDLETNADIVANMNLDFTFNAVSNLSPEILSDNFYDVLIEHHKWGSTLKRF